MAEKLTRMKADTFRARVRLGLGFDGPVHVPESLRLRDGSVEHLCGALCVDGHLDLEGCIQLEALPERLVVRGKLTMDGCARIDSLPPTVRELFGLSAAGCSRLASIGSLVECRGPLDLRGCDAFAPLPADFKAVNCVELDGLWIGATFIALKCQLPDVVRDAAIGKRIGDVVSHRILGDHRLLDAVISDARESMTWGGVVLDVDTSSMIIVDKNK